MKEEASGVIDVGNRPVLSVIDGKILFLLFFSTLTSVLGVLLFYSQVILGWWHPNSYSHYFLQVIVVGLYAVSIAGSSLGIIKYSNGLKITKLEKALFSALILLFVTALFFAIKPSHLPQEEDLMNYHFLMAKNPWYKGNWSPLENHPYEFLHVGLQNSLSPYWIAFPLLNKLPQFFIQFALLIKLLFIPSILFQSKKKEFGLLFASLFFSARGVAIQLGTGMPDLLSVDLLLGGMIALFLIMDHKIWIRLLSFIFGINLSLFLTYKSFSLAVVVLMVIATALTYFSSELRFRMGVRAVYKNISLIGILVPITIIWLPFLVRDFHYTGDPFFPVFPVFSKMFCSNQHLENMNCENVLAVANSFQALINSYGVPKSLYNFVYSLFSVALPSSGSVNNVFDYPLGVSWILVLLSFFVVLFTRFRKHPTVKYAGFTAGLTYLLWFMGSQQSRWLYPSYLSLILGVGYVLLRIQNQKIIRSIFIFLMFTTMVAEARLIRSQRNTLACFGVTCLDNTKYYIDYNHKCSKIEIPLTDTGLRGYLQCEVTVKNQ